MTTALPDPPAQLPDLTDDHVADLPAGWPLLRIHDTAGPHGREFHELRWWGPIPDRGRFDHHPDGPPADHAGDHGVLYLACPDPTRSLITVTGAGALPGNALDVAIAEFAQADQQLTVTEGLTLTLFTLPEPLRLLDVRGSWAQATRAGAHLSTAPHHETQRWARAIRAAYPHLNGVLYAPSTGGRGVAVVLNETNVHVLANATVQLSRRLTDATVEGLLNAAARRLQLTLTFPA